MPDAHDRGRDELGREQLHQLVLARRIERRSCLVQHDDVRTAQQDARKREPLLLAAGQDPVPGCLLIDAIDQVVEAHQAQRARDLRRVLGLGGLGIGGGPTQRANRDIRALRQQQHVGSLCHLHAAFAPRP